VFHSTLPLLPDNNAVEVRSKREFWTNARSSYLMNVTRTQKHRQSTRRIDYQIGTFAVKVVPIPSSDVNEKRPPTRLSLSRTLISPKPGPESSAPRLNPFPLSLTFKINSSLLVWKSTFARVAWLCFAIF